MVGRSLLLFALTLEVMASSAVYIAEPKVFTAMPLANLPALCGTENSVQACTTFERPILTTHCRKEDRWLLDATLDLAPTLLLTSSRYLGHEMTHLRDIDARLERYLRHITAPRYATREQCLQAAGLAIFTFPREFERVKAESNLELDGLRDPGRRVLASAQ
jgi:hypothetical protein